MTIDRRRFLAKAGGVAAVTATTIIDAPSVIAQPKIQWRMSTGWTTAFDVHQGMAQRLGKIVEDMSGGRFRIEVFPGGQIMPPFDCFDATSQGKIEAFMGTGQYWSDKEPALEWFTTIPFGMIPRAWPPGITRVTASSSAKRPTPRSTSCHAPPRRSLHKWPDGFGRSSPPSVT
jgi:TRAP-type mannitol/chloroaromatic compound transport system substrate-binding protein